MFRLMTNPEGRRRRGGEREGTPNGNSGGYTDNLYLEKVSQ